MKQWFDELLGKATPRSFAARMTPPGALSTSTVNQTGQDIIPLGSPSPMMTPWFMVPQPLFHQPMDGGYPSKSGAPTSQQGNMMMMGPPSPMWGGGGIFVR